MSWTSPRTWNVGEIVTKALMDLHIRDNLKYLKGESGVPTTQSGLIIDNTLGSEYLKLPLLTTSQTGTVLTTEGQTAHDSQTHRIKVHDGTAVRSLVSTIDVDDTPVDAATTDPVSSNWAYDFINTLTASQDLPIASAAGVWTKLVKGTANQWLKMASDASTVGWSSITGNSSKIKSETRALDAVAGDVAYTGYGFTPKAIIIIYMLAPNFNFGVGVGDSALAEMTAYLAFNAGHLTNTSGFDATKIVVAVENSSTTGETAVLKTLDADGFTLTWAVVGVGYAGTLNMLVLALA